MSNAPKMIVDGREISFRQGMTIMGACRFAGIDIPSLCFLKGVNAIGSCRICLVEVEGHISLISSCNTLAEEGMVVHTNTERVQAARKMSLQLILAKHGLSSTQYCFSCVKNGACELQDVSRKLGITEVGFDVEPASGDVVDSNPFLRYDPKLCITCQRCVGACNTQAGNHSLRAGRKGVETSILAPFGADWKSTLCESCGCCAHACPTGALTEKRRDSYSPWEVEKVQTTCPHCAVGCQYKLVVKDGRIVDTEAVNGPANKGRLCVKGRSASFDFVHSPNRLTTPLVRNYETGELEPATWDEALDLVAKRFLELRDTYGPESLAAFACARSTNEDCYMLMKMARTAFKTNNVDNCARVCHGPSVMGLYQTLGSGAMTNTIQDISEQAQVIMLVGSNPEEAHPVFGMQLRHAVETGTKLIVVDPRNIGIADKADIHLKLRPGTNVAFANGIVHLLIRDGLYDEQFVAERTENFEELRDMVASYTPERVAQICCIDVDDLVAAAHLYGEADRAAIVYCLGVTEHSTGTEGVMSLSNIAMVAGKIGRPGCGVNPVRGQNNVQGASDMAATPTDYPGYQKLATPGVIEKFEEAWGVELPRFKGLTATECFPAAVEKKIRGLFIFGEDPIRTDPDTNHVIRALEALDFLVVDDLFLTVTAQYADVVLPGRSYAEKTGTFANTERRVQMVRKAVEIKGTRADTDIFIDLMNRMGYPQPSLTPSEIMDEIASLTPQYGGISHERLESKEVRGQGLQWPCPTPDHPGTPIMHTAAFTRGLGYFSTAEYRPSSELPDEEYPILLVTGRILNQYNACAMTDKTEGMNEICGSSFIEVNDEDAARLGIADGDRVTVSSRRGAIESTARVSGKTSVGEVWMPFHFQDGNANWLTNASLCNIARTPEYKVCAVRIERAERSANCGENSDRLASRALHDV